MPDVKFKLSTQGDYWKDLAADGKVLSVDEAAKVIAKRLGGTGENYLYVDNMWPQGKKMATLPVSPDRERDYNLLRKAIQMLPEAMRTEEVLTRMDLRTLLDPVVAKDENPTTDVTVNGQVFTPEEQRSARSAFVDYSKKVIEDYQKDLNGAGIAGDEQLAMVEEARNAWRDDKTSLVPVRINMDTYNAAAEQATVTGGKAPSTGTAGSTTVGQEFDTSSLNDPVDAAATAPPSFMTLNDYKLMFRDYDPDAALGQYMSDQGGRQAYLADPNRVGLAPGVRDPTNLDLEGITARRGRTTLGTGSLAQIQEASTYLGPLNGGFSLSQAKSQLASMTREEISKLTDRMKKAGIFDQVGGEPTIKGDFDDPKLKQAWTALLAKSLQSGKKPNELLDELSLGYEEHLADKVHTHVTDPALLRTSADLMARKLIGRKLKPAEQAGLTKFILELERKTNTASVAAETGGGETTDVDWQAQMEEYITHQHPTEAAAKDIANAYDMFKGMLGPAGGSVQ